MVISKLVGTPSSGKILVEVVNLVVIVMAREKTKSNSSHMLHTEV